MHDRDIQAPRGRGELPGREARAGRGGAVRRSGGPAVRPPSLEALTVLLGGGCRESDAEIAYRTGCRAGLVAQAREFLGMPPLPVPQGRRRTIAQRVMVDSVLTPNGHRRWTGRVTRDGVPVLDNAMTVARAVFRMTHGRAPEGQVRVDCTMPHCVEGTHLTDRVMREEREERALLDVTRPGWGDVR